MDFGLDSHAKAYCTVTPGGGTHTVAKKHEKNTGGQTMTVHINFYDP